MHTSSRRRDCRSAGATATIRPRARTTCWLTSSRPSWPQVPALDPALIGDVVGGCALPEAEQGLNVARMAIMLAGLPKSVPGMQVNRFCSSGLQAVAMAADRIRTGDEDVMIGCGTETHEHGRHAGQQDSAQPGGLRRLAQPRRRDGHGPDCGKRGRALESVARRSGRVRPAIAPAGDRRDTQRDSSPPKPRPTPSRRGCRISPTDRSRRPSASSKTTRARAPTSPWRSWPSSRRCSPPRARSRPATPRRCRMARARC